MTDKIKAGDRVKLVTFNGRVSPVKGIKPTDNYWKLIGMCGQVLDEFPPREIARDRVLVKIDQSVIDLGLSCHNEIENTLWLQRRDLIVGNF